MNTLLRFAPLWLLLLVLAAFGSALPGGFYLDDLHVVERNVHIRALENIPQFFVDGSMFTDLPGNRDYRPLVLTVFTLIHDRFGLQPWAFTLVSILLHWLVVLLVFSLVRGILLWVSSDELAFPSPQEASLAALVTASLFAVHTVTTETVNYVNGQAVLLVTLGYLAAMRSYARWLVAADEGESRVMALRWLLLALVAQVFALGSKPTAITLPVMLFVYDWLFARRSQTLARGLMHKAQRLLPFILVNVVYLWWRTVVLAAPFGEAPVRSYAVNTLTQIKAMAFYYLKLFLWPVDLSIDPTWAVSTSLREPEVLGAIGVLAALILALVLVGRRFRILVFCGFWAIVTILPVSFIKPLPQLVNEHRIYLPLFGLVLPIGLLIVGLAQRLRRPLVVRALAAATAILLLMLVIQTNQRNRVWQSELALWQDAAAKSQDPGESRARELLDQLSAAPHGEPAAATPGPQNVIEGQAGRLRLQGALSSGGQSPASATESTMTGGRFRATLTPRGVLPVPAPRAEFASGDQLDRAARLLEALHDHWPGHAGILYRLGDVQVRRGDVDQAVSAFRAFLALDEGTADQRSRARDYVARRGTAPQ